MKKLVTILSSVAILLALTSCGSTKVEATESAESTAAAPAAGNIVMELPTSEMLLLDNFEDGNYWYGVGDSWDQWGSHNLSLLADLSTDWGTDGETSLKCRMEPALESTSKQATWCCNSPIETDLSAYNYCAVDVYNPEDYIFNLDISIQNGTDWGWNSSPAIQVGKGTHTLVFDLSSFPRENLANVFCFMIQHANMPTEGTTIYFDNFRMYK